MATGYPEEIAYNTLETSVFNEVRCTICQKVRTKHRTYNCILTFSFCLMSLSTEVS